MLPNVRNFHRPQSIAEAVRLLNSETERNVVLGGGTQLALSANPGIEGLVDLRNLGLDYRKSEGDAVVLGARSRPTDAIRFPDLAKVAGGIVTQAASNYLAEVQRNRASLGGILISASSWADLATALLAAGGTIVLACADGDKSISIDDFFAQGPIKAAKRAIIKELRIPSGGSGAYRRLAQTETDISIVSVAVRADRDGGKTRLRLAVGGVAPLPVRVPEAEELLAEGLTEASVERAAAALSFEDAPGDFRASAEYRNETARVLARRCLGDLLAAGPAK